LQNNIVLFQYNNKNLHNLVLKNQKKHIDKWFFMCYEFGIKKPNLEKDA